MFTPSVIFAISLLVLPLFVKLIGFAVREQKRKNEKKIRNLIEMKKQEKTAASHSSASNRHNRSPQTATN